MKKLHLLKGLRVVLAILFFLPILLFFVDIRGELPGQLHLPARLQLLPALLDAMNGFFLFWLAWTLVFGRTYCSVICPAGILQDVINRIFCIGKKKKKGVLRFRYHTPSNVFRYVFAVVTFGLAVFGVAELFTLFDPYSNFGRIAANLFRPVVQAGNNLLADGLHQTGYDSLYHVPVASVTVASLTAAVTALLLFVVTVVFRGRYFCNTLCPVGALLSVVSRCSIFRIVFDEKACLRCRSCEYACKAEAIHPQAMKVDMSRCVGCFNCLSSCRQNALSYRLAPLVKKALPVAGALPERRREFLATGIAVVSAFPLALAKVWQKKTGIPVIPPGSLNLTHFRDKCTACHLCITKCPSHVLRPAGPEYGFDYLLKPYMAYIDSYCNFECVTCSEICPAHAIRPLTVEEKKITQIGIARFSVDLCIVHTEENDCGACSEHCPTQAVHMVPYKGTLTIPQVEPELCVGCGGCESICPVRPVRAILVEANETHRTAEKPEEEEALDIHIDEFGF
ncbi:MAG: 4Fe-4S binding protein [Tannerella sp.]|jgi:ferredoxin|nr:4Fe-4S binding protein [Tannerella sp.]